MISAIFLSGGVGSRMGTQTPKQFLPLAGKPLALHSYELIARSKHTSEVIVVCESAYQGLFTDAKYASPGPRRQDSLFNGLQNVSTDCEYVLVHDAARPLLQEQDIEAVIQAAIEHGAATLATPVKETVKQANSELFVTQTLERSKLYNIQTPQVIKKELLIKGFEYANNNKITVTDDVSLAELIDRPVKLIMGSNENIKVTLPEDLALAENHLRDYAAAQQI